MFKSGDMIDFIIADIGVGWETYAEECRKQGINPAVGRFGNKSQEELLAMMERAKQDAANRKQ